MNRKLTNCENLASLAYSGNAVGGKCLYHQIAVCVLSFSQPYPPLQATKEDIGGQKTQLQKNNV